MYCPHGDPKGHFVCPDCLKLMREEVGTQILDSAYLVSKPLEKDPNGIPAGTPGAKLDAGKVPVVQGCLHYFPNALTEVARLSYIGSRKYSWRGWEKVPDGVNRYGDALGRHEFAIAGDFQRRDPDTGVIEATAVAWNA